MKAAIAERYGPPEVVVIREVATPVPKDNEVLIKVHATTVNSGDVRLRAMRVPSGVSLMVRVTQGFFKLRQPVLGFDVAGDIEAMGKDVSKFKRGDRVIASRGFALAAHAEYFVVPEDGAIATIPETLSYSDAASLLFGGATALEFFRRGKLRAGETILINGASGAVGTSAVQLAKHMGAKVTAVCSAAHAGLVKSLGADHVIDYAAEDFTQNGKTYDVIMDNHGNAPYSRVKGSLRPGGRFMMVIFGNLGEMIGASFNKANVSASDDTAISAESYGVLMNLAASGTIKPVIDSTYPFAQIVEAHRRVDTGHKVGSVVVTVP